MYIPVSGVRRESLDYIKESPGSRENRLIFRADEARLLRYVFGVMNVISYLRRNGGRSTSKKEQWDQGGVV